MNPLYHFKRQTVLRLFWLFSFFLLLQACPTSLSALSAYSNNELEELEKEFVQQINQSPTVERNPLANQYINHLGKKLSQFAAIPSPHFFIVKSNEINAFAGPGGHIGINTQLILVTTTESELAAVMAHELAHVRLHHLYNLIQHEKQMRIPMLASILAAAALGMVNPTLGTGAILATLGGFAQDNINFTRANEKQADRIGIDMLVKAGFDGKGMVTFFKKMQETSRYYYTDNIPAILRTHPLDDDRMAEAENRLQRLEKKNRIDSLNYHLFKELIRNAIVQNKQQLLAFYHSCPRNHPSSCQYGEALTHLQLQQYRKAKQLLIPLLSTDPDNLFYQDAMAAAEMGSKEFKEALNRLSALHANFPENYAALMIFSKGLLSMGEAKKASAILLKGFRQFKKDLALCELLAQAQAASHQENYAYFTQAQCALLQGQHREAVRRLKQSLLLSKKDPYLQARSKALLEEIKFLYEN